MEKDKLESLLIDYIDGVLSAEEREQVEKMLREDVQVKQLLDELKAVMHEMSEAKQWEPSDRLKVNFLKSLQEENRSGGKQVWMSPFAWRMAAAVALVMSGVVIGYFLNKNYQQEQEMLALKKQMDEMKQMMMAGLNNEFSPSQRMMGVSVAYSLEKADDEIVSALVKTMLEDENTNVRLAALEALSKFSGEPFVRKKLVESLHLQKDPMVQISLIQLMVKMKEKGVVKELEKITTDEKTMKAVKDEAYKGILKLS